MQFLRTVFDQFKTVWEQASKPARIGFGVSTTLVIAALVGLVVWSSRPQFVPLATDLSPTQTAELVSKLDAEGIDNQLNFSGSSVLVPKTQWNRARVLAGDLAGPAVPQGVELSESVLSDPDLNHFRILRNREEALARTLMRMDAIAGATVHISQPEESPFVRDQEPTTASVVLQIRPQVPFSRAHVAAIVSLVSNSVDGLSANDVSVMDTKGRLLSSNASGMDADISSQIAFRQKLEGDLATKAESMLGQLLGPGRAAVRVTADVDFTQTKREETTFDPDAKVKKREKINTLSQKGGTSVAGGAAGSASNLSVGGPDSGTPIEVEKEETETEYESPKTVDTVIQAAGAIKRLTVAATVDLSSTEDEAAVTRDQVEAIIKQAVGFDDTRNDQVEVLVSKLAGATPIDTGFLESQKWDNYHKLARNASLGLASLAALILGFVILRRFSPLTVPADRQPSEPESRPFLADLAQQAKDDPEAFARIVSGWLDAQEVDNQRRNDETRPAAA